MTFSLDAPPAPAAFAAPNPSARTLNIFLTDDHAVVREGLKTLINTQPDMRIVGEAQDGEIAWKMLRQLSTQADKAHDVDVMVMDISMPNVNGVEATTAIRQAYPHIKVLALSMHEDKSYLRELLAAGATGYVLKRSAAEELIRAIRLVAAGGNYLDPNLAAKVMDSLASRPPLRGEMTGAALSERESDVLSLIAQGFTNKEIATQLVLSVKTIETYKARAMEKLNLGSRAEIVRYALQQGWLSKS